MPFEKPNYTQVPNDLLGHIESKKRGGDKPGMMANMGLAELKVALALIRLTFGFAHKKGGHNSEAWVSLTRLQKLTGLSRECALNGANKAVERGIFSKDTSGGVTRYEIVVGVADRLVRVADQESRGSRPPSIKETIKETVIETSLPAPTAQADEPEPVYDYDDLDGEQGEKSERGYMIPELPIHFQVLDVNHAKRFRKTRQKSRLTGLSKALEAWEALVMSVGPAKAYQVTLGRLQGAEAEYLEEPLPPIPPSWVEFRLQNAKDNRWGTAMIVRLLFSRDMLITHCNYKLKRMNIPVKREYREEEGWD